LCWQQFDQALVSIDTRSATQHPIRNKNTLQIKHVADAADVAEFLGEVRDGVKRSEKTFRTHIRTTEFLADKKENP